MNILELQLTTTLILILWFDLFGLHNIILSWFGKEVWQIESHHKWYLQLFACYFCTGFWIGTIVSGIYFGLTYDWRTALTLLVLNFVITRILDNLLGFDSIKSK